MLPQFVNRSAGHVPAQMLLLALLSVCIGLVSDCAWGFTGSAVRAWARGPRTGSRSSAAQAARR